MNHLLSGRKFVEYVVAAFWNDDKVLHENQELQLPSNNPVPIWLWVIYGASGTIYESIYLSLWYLKLVLLCSICFSSQSSVYLVMCFFYLSSFSFKYTHVSQHSLWMARATLNRHLLVKKQKNCSLFSWCPKTEINRF